MTTTGDSLMRIFWPSNAPRTQLPGVVVGWKNSDLEFFVLTILEMVEVHTPQVHQLYRLELTLH